MRFWLRPLALGVLAGCSNSALQHSAPQVVADEVRPIRPNPGLTPVSLFGDRQSDLIVKAFSMRTGTSMGVRVTVLADARRLVASAGDESEDNLFGPVSADWKKGSFAAIPFAEPSSSNPKLRHEDRNYIDLEIHEGVCWHDDIQFFQKYHGGGLVGTYAVVANVKMPPALDAYDDLAGAETLATLYILQETEPPTAGFAGIFEPVEFFPVRSIRLPRASCNPSDMTGDYERLVQQG